MTRLLILVGVLGICGGMIVPNAWAVPTPIFYNSLDSDAAITASGGTIQPSADTTKHTYVAGFSNNAFASNTNSGANYANWNNATISTLFTGWTNANGITVDLYFQGTDGTDDEGLWSMVRRSTSDNYFITQLKAGKLRIAFSDSSAQYKFTFDGTSCGGVNPCGGSNQEKIDGINFNLTNGVVYHLTTSVNNGVFKVWLDDVGGTDYSNAAPIYDNNTILPGTFVWPLPSSSTSATILNRTMTIGNRGPSPNFGGTLRSGHWVDEVKVYNGVYTPAELVAIAGDYDGDGSVDAADYALWRQLENETGAGLPADGSGSTPGTPDLVVDNLDYDFWAANFGNPPASATLTSTAVPEPSMIVLMACACLAFAMRRSR